MASDWPWRDGGRLKAGVAFQTPRHGRAGPRGHREVLVPTAWWPFEAQGGRRSLRMCLSFGFSASSLILIPEWLGALFPGCPEGLSHRHALFFLLCDRVMSRGLLSKGGWNVPRAAVCWCHRAVGSWAGLSAPRTKWRDTTGRLGLQKEAGPGGQASGHRVHGAPAASGPASCWARGHGPCQSGNKAHISLRCSS